MASSSRLSKSTQDKTPMVVLSTASPYKFSDSVLSALGEDISDKDEFALLDKLSTLDKDKIPQAWLNYNLYLFCIIIYVQKKI